MLNKMIQIGKEVARQIAISFFFASLLFVIIHFVFSEKINTYLSLINMMTVVEKQVEKQETTFDSIEKRLVNYPSWGTIWATIKIPDIGVEAPVYHGDTLDIIKYGVGHYSGSYFPGEGGTIILAAHNSRQHFMYLPKLKEGAEVTIEASYGTFTYRLIATKIIGEKEMESLPVQTEKEILMMYTCYPVNTIGHKTKRYVVYLELVGENHEN